MTQAALDPNSLPAPDWADRRQYERKLLRVPAQMIVPGVGQISVRTIDISLGGIGVISDAKLPMMAEGMIRLSIPTMQQTVVDVICRATIMHCIYNGDLDGFKVGLKFTEMSMPTRDAIYRFIRM